VARILLVHGAWHGTWCWDDFAVRLERRGHGVSAVALRGHVQPAARGRIWHRIRDYVEDVRTAAAELDGPPILVGHSMGGFVVQKVLEESAAAGGVLMAPAPPWGVVRTTARIALRHPLAFLKANLLLRLRPLVATPALVRGLLFSPDTPADIVERSAARVQDESYLAYLDMLLLAHARPRRVRAPLLVLGGERDAIFTPGQVRRTARAYGTQAEFFAGMGHDLMLDAGWERVADRVDAWARGLPSTPREGAAAGSP
jgi:pimeloyl-ACP methyl ester carboxylesterase